MAHFAIVDKKTASVENVIVVANTDLLKDGLEYEKKGVEFISDLLKLSEDKAVIQTSYNANFRYNYAGIGYSYDFKNEAFITPMPTHPAFEFNEKEELVELQGTWSLDTKQFVWVWQTENTNAAHGRGRAPIQTTQDTKQKPQAPANVVLYASKKQIGFAGYFLHHARWWQRAARWCVVKLRVLGLNLINTHY